MMLVISYDVDTTDTAGIKRLRRAAKLCERYGCRVQNSVFEVLVTPAQLVVLKAELYEIIDKGRDSVRFYRLGSNWRPRIETIGKESTYEQDGVIIL